MKNNIVQNTPILLICGNAGSGKDTTAGFIKNIVPNTKIIAQAAPMKMLGSSLFKFTDEQLYGPSESRNAPDPRFDKEEVWDYLYSNDEEIESWLKFCGLENQKGFFLEWFTNLHNKTASLGITLSPRIMLQELGTEFGRAIDKNLWASLTIKKAKEMLLNGTDLVIISDGRFRNEIVEAKTANAKVILIKSFSADQTAVGVKNHQSEEELKKIPPFWFDATIYNAKKGLDAFKEQIQNFCYDHYGFYQEGPHKDTNK
jgi:hypothetical protein